VLSEISGKVLKDVVDPKDPTKLLLKAGDMVKSIPQLQADGSTSSGAWILAGVMAGPKDAPNLSKRRDNKSDPSGLGIYPKFAWTWPGNIHILYNRASADASGKPWAHLAEKKLQLVWWDEAKKEWAGHDNPDVPVKTDGPDTPTASGPFRMNAEGVGRLIAVAQVAAAGRRIRRRCSPRPTARSWRCRSTLGRAERRPHAGVLRAGGEPGGPTPCTPAGRATRSSSTRASRRCSPSARPGLPLRPDDLVDQRARCGGSTTRNVPWLNELVPEPCVELPEPLAKKLGLRTGDRARVSSARGEIEVKAVVTRRMEVMKIGGQEVTVVWMPYNWGFKGLSTGPSTNYLTIDVGDPNTWCQETKACLVNVVPAAQAVAQQSAPAGKGV
jgi:formate dehydrogenase major subunit